MHNNNGEVGILWMFAPRELEVTRSNIWAGVATAGVKSPQKAKDEYYTESIGAIVKGYGRSWAGTNISVPKTVWFEECTITLLVMPGLLWYVYPWRQQPARGENVHVLNEECCCCSGTLFDTDGSWRRPRVIRHIRRGARVGTKKHPIMHDWLPYLRSATPFLFSRAGIWKLSFPDQHC